MNLEQREWFRTGLYFITVVIGLWFIVLLMGFLMHRVDGVLQSTPTVVGVLMLVIIAWMFGFKKLGDKNGKMD